MSLCMGNQAYAPQALPQQAIPEHNAYPLRHMESGAVGSVSQFSELEADYDEGATELYRRIEGKDWDGALAALEANSQEAKTWISRKEFNSNDVRWRLLPLHATCIFRSPLSLIEGLISAYPDGPHMKDDQGMLPIHLACRNGASKGVVVTLLNSFPESVSVVDRKGRTPLALVEASSSQNKDAVVMALKRFQQEIASGFAIRSTHSLMSATVLGNTNPSEPEVDYEHRTILFRLILKKDWTAAAARAHSFPDESFIWIVTKGFNGNLRFLPIHKACVLQPPESLIEALLAANIEGAKSRDQDGWMPIHCAVFYGANDGVVNTLLVANPKGAQSKDDEGRLPLHYACLKCASEDVVKSLLNSFPKGAMSKDDEGRLPIHYACSKGAPESVIDALLKSSAKGAQSKDDQGRLPLHHACRKGASEHVIQSLLRVYSRGAQIKDDQDKLPIHYACQNCASPNIVSLLLSTYPESINVKNGFGYTPLAEARAVENEKMEPVLKVLEKFKVEQDQLKVDCEENIILDSKLSQMTLKIQALEATIAAVANLGKDLKTDMKKSKDPHVLLARFADKLSNIDSNIEATTGDASPDEKRKGPLSRLRSPKNKK
mmetsp:Transcript_30013/g.45517  ORF Transcript_30013/g.45517 Transcript_30013/m.45517 type:complete len:604 (-) Transcript_30013:102-1913(-)|eukprot:CAMPEP_0178900756 /NCGR_PEP_ID=MMETSP0786-20121207/3644_1 /TAXON_ID=186022 /ORGANISM="Thalassionema frauenfeldii, Strain CCMP 1798" /LENGTH=603 /DNA_ID=CAMNT_0020571783 /DNA_START=62 /DNA_END=1873 /DNA_ORIENTATION=+